MNILDENILLSQCDQLRARKVHFRQIGLEIGRPGMKDRSDIIPSGGGLLGAALRRCQTRISLQRSLIIGMKGAVFPSRAAYCGQGVLFCRFVKDQYVALKTSKDKHSLLPDYPQIQ